VKILVTPQEVKQAIAFWLLEMKHIEASPQDITQADVCFRGGESDDTGEFSWMVGTWRVQKSNGQAPDDQGPGRPDPAPGPEASSSRRRAGDCF
jgi:hypothetical protein